MKQKRLMSIIAVIILAITTFWAGSVYAATNCFTDTNGHKFEQAICWMKANGLASGAKFFPDNFTTRGQAAQWIQKSANIPPSTGLILISAGMNWQSFFSTDNLVFERYSTVLYVKKGTTGGNFVSLHPPIPTVLYGRSLKLVAAEVCYTATASAYLDYIEINTYKNTTAPGGALSTSFSDSTDRTDSTCRYYALPTPVILTSEDGVNIYFYGNWTVANSPLLIGRTTLVFAPTTVKASPPADANVTTLQEGGSSQLNSTSSP